MDRRQYIKGMLGALGLAASPGLFAAALSGCRAPSSEGFLRPDERLLVTDLAEALIPETDTPGATAAGVPDFIDMMLAEFAGEDERAEFRAQLAQAGDWVASKGADRFSALAPSDQAELLDALDQQAFGGPVFDPVSPGERPLMARLKAWTVVGYYTSPVGALQELHQPPMGLYRADIPLEEVGKTWA